MGIYGEAHTFIRAVLCLLLLTFTSISVGIAGQTSGGVAWKDPLGYTKPAFVSITVPDEATSLNNYYINLSSGSDSNNCTSANTACATFKGLGSKGYAALTGGPAYIYIWGSGSFQYDSAYASGSNALSIWGAAGSEIVIKPRPGYTATLTYNVVQSNQATDRFQYIVWDGGPDMAITFYAGSNQYNGAWNFEYLVSNDNLSYWTFYRTQWRCGNSSGDAFRAYGRSVNISFINNEFYDCNTGPNDVGHQIYLAAADSSAAYPGDCSGVTCAVVNYLFKNNIIRDNNNGLEVNIRGGSAANAVDGLTITGNAFHNIGFGLCATTWQCRPAVTLGTTSNGNPQFRNVLITNNLIWNTASSAIWARAGTPLIYNNTLYDYGNGSGGGGPNPQAISGYNNGGGGDIRGNIIYSPSGVNPFDGSSFTTYNNVCGSGKTCGSSSTTYSASTFLSTDPNNPNFLKIGGSSAAAGTGTNMGVSIDYAGYSRQGSSANDIGAFVLATSTAQLPSPQNLRIK